MSVAVSSANPLKPSRWVRFRSWLNTFPRWVRWGVPVAFVLLTVAAGSAFAWKRAKNQKRNAVVEQWERFEKAAKTANEDDLEAAVNGVLAIDPTDDRAVRYKAALETGEAAEGDTALCFLTTVLHWKKNDLPAAAREARKRLVHAPNDWIARCIIAQAALTAGDPKAADEELSRLPDPVVSPPNNLSAVLLAHHLFSRTGRDQTALRRLVNDAVVDLLGSVTVEKNPPGAKAQLVECYLIGFDRTPNKPQLNRLSLGLTPAGKLLDQAIPEAAAKGDTAALARLGTVCNQFDDALDLLLRDKQITADQHAALARQHDDRTGKLWQAVTDRDPKAVAGYQFAALRHLRGGRVEAAREVVTAGLTACGDQPQLLALLTQLMVHDGQAADAARRSFLAAEREPANVVLWVIAAESAMAAGRRDIAMAACQKARDLAPANPFAIRTEVSVRLATGDAHGAVQLLQKLGEPALLADSRLGTAYTRSLAVAGLGVHIPDFLTKAEAAAVKAGSPATALGGLTGVAVGPYDPDTFKLAADLLDRLTNRWPSDTEVMRVRAALLRKAAEEAEPRWETGRVQAAVAALERVRATDPQSVDLAAALAWVRLKGANNPPEALRDATPIAAAADRGDPVPAAQLTVLGAVRLANKQIQPALASLELARKTGAGSASGSIHLSLAYHAAGRPDDARAMLADARNRPMTPQDATDFAAAQATVLREKP